ncbi:MAG: hypothetical protein ACWA49_06610 [Ruegeria sp.]
MSNSTVAGAATQKGALTKHSTTVLGVFGPQNDMRALMRLSSGRVKKVKTGNRIGSGTIVAIDKDGIMLRHSGQTKRIAIPGS